MTFRLLLIAMLVGPVVSSHNPDHPREQKVTKKELHKKLEKLLKEQGGIKRDVIGLENKQEDLETKLDKILHLQPKVNSLGDDASGLAEVIFNDTIVILNNNDNILDGQGRIRELIETKHDATRDKIRDSQAAEQSDIADVLEGQDKILDRLQENGNLIDRHLEKVQDVQAKTKTLVERVENTEGENHQENLQGQANISAEVKAAKKWLLSKLQEVLNGQGTIEDKIKDMTKDELDKIKDVLRGQGDLENALQDSHNAILADIEMIKDSEENTKDKINGARTSVRSGLEEVMAAQNETVELAGKCEDAGKCDLSEVLKGLGEIEDAVEDLEKTLDKGFDKMVAKQEATQDQIIETTKTLAKQINHEHAQTNDKIRDISQTLHGFKKKLAAQNKIIEANIRATKSSQTSTLTLIEKIQKIVDKLLKISKFKSIVH